MSVCIGTVGNADEAGDEAYFMTIIQVETRYLLDYVNQGFASNVAADDAKIPLVQDTRDYHTNLYATPAMNFLGDAGEIETFMHRASDGLIVGQPVKYFVWGGSIADRPMKLASDGLDAISAAPPSADPTTFREKLMWDVQRRRNSTMTSTAMITKDDDGNVITQQPLSDNGTSQNMGKPL